MHRGPLPTHDSIIEACIGGGLFISFGGAVTGGLLAAMPLGLFTLDYDSAYRAYEVMLSGVFLIMLPVEIVAGLLAPWVLLIFGIELRGAFSKSAALLFAALSGLIYLARPDRKIKAICLLATLGPPYSWHSPRYSCAADRATTYTAYPRSTPTGR